VTSFAISPAPAMPPASGHRTRRAAFSTIPARLEARSPRGVHETSRTSLRPALHQFTYDAAEYGRDFKLFHSFVKEEFPEIMGPRSRHNR